MYSFDRSLREIQCKSFVTSQWQSFAHSETESVDTISSVGVSINVHVFLRSDYSTRLRSRDGTVFIS